jgi:hypothetical protein
MNELVTTICAEQWHGRGCSLQILSAFVTLLQEFDNDSGSSEVFWLLKE